MSNYKQLKLIYIYILAIANCTLLIVHYGRQFYSDTLSYLIAWDNISNGQIDKWRTPLYPLFLGSVKTIFGHDYFPICAVIIQFLFFGVSIYYFNKLASVLLQSKTISYWLTAFYALYPCVPTWNCFLVTEPFAIYAIVFLLYSTFYSIYTPSRLHVVMTSFWLLFLVFLRPALIYLLPVYLGGWLTFCAVNNKITKPALSSLIGTILVGLALGAYSFSFKKAYGMFTPSGIGVVNQYYIARIDGAIDSNKTNNPNLKAYLDKSFSVHGKVFANGSSHELYQEAIVAIDTYGLNDVSNLVSASYKGNIKQYTKRVILHIHRTATDNLFDSFLPMFRTIIDFIGIRINIVYFLLFFLSFYIDITDKNEKEDSFLFLPIVCDGFLSSTHNSSRLSERMVQIDSSCNTMLLVNVWSGVIIF